MCFQSKQILRPVLCNITALSRLPTSQHAARNAVSAPRKMLIAQSCINVLFTGLSLRARGRGFPRLLLLENRRKIEPKEIPSCLIPRRLVVFTRQLEILVTTLIYVRTDLALNTRTFVATYHAYYRSYSPISRAIFTTN